MNGAVMMDVDEPFAPLNQKSYYSSDYTEDVDMGCVFAKEAGYSSASFAEAFVDPFPFTQLPIEVMILVLSCFSARDLLNMTQCSRDLRQLCDEGVVWKRLAKKHFGVEKGGILKRNLPSWKLYYAQKSVMSRSDIFSWDELQPSGELPSKRYQHTASVLGSSIYFIGGQELPDKRFNEIYCFDTKRQTVERLTPRIGSVPRYARHTAVPVADKIYTFGGYDGIREHFHLCVYDTLTNDWTTPQVRGELPVSRTNHAATAIGHNMYMFGGMYKEPGERLVFLNDFHVLDTTTNTWSRIHATGAVPQPRCGHRLVAFGGKLVLFGGGSGEHWDKKYNDIHVFDPEKKLWTKPRISGAAPVCTFTIAFSMGAFLFLFGGQSLHDNSLTSDLYVLDTIAWTWEKLTPQNASPTARDMGSGSMVDNAMFMFGGYCGTAIDNFFSLKLSDQLIDPFRSPTAPSPASLPSQGPNA